MRGLFEFKAGRFGCAVSYGENCAGHCAESRIFLEGMDNTQLLHLYVIGCAASGLPYLLEASKTK